ncbi:hypothetical protein J0S82_008757, partial [Galemys pyrenaicus]
KVLPKSVLFREDRKSTTDINSEQSVSTVEEHDSKTPPETLTEHPKSRKGGKLEKKSIPIKQTLKRELNNMLSNRIMKGTTGSFVVAHIQPQQNRNPDTAKEKLFKKIWGEIPAFDGILMKYAIMAAISTINQWKTSITSGHACLRKLHRNPFNNQMKGFSITLKLFFLYLPNPEFLLPKETDDSKSEDDEDDSSK